MENLKRFLQDERGLESVEYALVAGLVTVAVIAAVAILAGNITVAFLGLDNRIK